MGKKLTFYCDICKKEVGNLTGAVLPSTTWEQDIEYRGYELCNQCYNTYEAKMLRLKSELINCE